MTVVMIFGSLKATISFPYTQYEIQFGILPTKAFRVALGSFSFRPHRMPRTSKMHYHANVSGDFTPHLYCKVINKLLFQYLLESQNKKEDRLYKFIFCD